MSKVRAAAARACASLGRVRALESGLVADAPRVGDPRGALLELTDECAKRLHDGGDAPARFLRGELGLGTVLGGSKDLLSEHHP